VGNEFLAIPPNTNRSTDFPTLAEVPLENIDHLT